MPVLQIGECWTLSLGGLVRHVQVVSSGTTPGWWHCLDLATETMFLAREEWFMMKAGEAPRNDPGASDAETPGN